MNLVRRSVVGCLLLLLATLAVAQDDDDSFDDDNAHSSAMLSLIFDRQGSVHVDLTLPVGDMESAELPARLAQSLHCPPFALNHPSGSEYATRDFQKNWSASRREQFRKQMAELNSRRLTGQCYGVLSKQSQQLSGDFDLAPVMPEFERLEVEELWVYVGLPNTQFREYNETHLIRNPMAPADSLAYLFPVAEDSGPLCLHVAYGFRPVDLQRALAILAGFIVFPVLLTVWMRRRALAAARVDAAAAWFGFFRTLNWLLLGASLLWLTSGLGARQMLQDWGASQGFPLWQAALFDVSISILPAFLPYFLCIVLSYPVHAQLRGAQWTRREFVLRQVTLLGVKVLPLMTALAAIGLMKDQPEFAVALLFLGFLLLQILLYLRFRITRQLPQPLTTGDLRDHIFAMAARLGVTVKQIFIVPAGKGQIANAYAAGSGIVMFTDYLLEHLSRREVDGVAAHELAHLRHKHPSHRILVFGAVIFLPSYFIWLCRTLLMLVVRPLFVLAAGATGPKMVAALWQALARFEQWQQRDFVLFVLGLTGFYFYSRHCENVADAAAVRLTGDAEAQITGLLKISRLNLMPIRWGKASESWLTHPSTVRRAQRMATVGGLAPERLEQILRDYDSEDSRAKVAPPEDRYVVPPATDPENVRYALRERTRTLGKFWANLALHVFPLAGFALVIERLHLVGYAAFASYVVAIALTSVLVTLGSVWLGESGKQRQKRRLVERFEREHLPVGGPGDAIVGFAPGPYPRIYGAAYHWDSGFLVLAKNQLQFVGHQVKFSFAPAEIAGVTIGPGGPSWWKFSRVYVRWQTENGRDGIFNLYSLEPGSVWQTNRRVHQLYSQIEQWRQHPENYPEVRTELKNLNPIELGQVTSTCPRKLAGLSLNLTMLGLLVILAAGVGMLTHTDMGYLIPAAIALRLIQSIPYWRYRDAAPAFSGSPESVVKARRAAHS